MPIAQHQGGSLTGAAFSFSPENQTCPGITTRRRTKPQPNINHHHESQPYPPRPEAMFFDEFLAIVDEDEHCCFWG